MHLIAIGTWLAISDIWFYRACILHPALCNGKRYSKVTFGWYLITTTAQAGMASDCLPTLYLGAMYSSIYNMTADDCDQIGWLAFYLFISLFICALGLYNSWQSVAYTSPNNAEILKAIAKGVCGGWVGCGDWGARKRRCATSFKVWHTHNLEMRRFKISTQSFQ